MGYQNCWKCGKKIHKESRPLITDSPLIDYKRGGSHYDKKRLHPGCATAVRNHRLKANNEAQGYKKSEIPLVIFINFFPLFLFPQSNPDFLWP
jgi:hypothetical protein